MDYNNGTNQNFENQTENNQEQNREESVFKPNQSYEYDPAGIVEESKGDNMALASMVCGILSILLCCCMGIFSLILGIVAIVLYKKSKDKDGGNPSTTAAAGLICGIIGSVIGVFSIAYWVLMFLGIVSSAMVTV